MNRANLTLTIPALPLALLWILPLLYAVWTVIHPAEFATRFDLFAPLTGENFACVWERLPFPRYFLNT